MRLMIIGPQGVGKGTQSALLSQALGVPHICTGELFRAATQRPGPNWAGGPWDS